jgi:hypothetical protein
MESPMSRLDFFKKKTLKKQKNNMAGTHWQHQLISCKYYQFDLFGTVQTPLLLLPKLSAQHLFLLGPLDRRSMQ